MLFLLTGNQLCLVFHASIIGEFLLIAEMQVEEGEVEDAGDHTEEGKNVDKVGLAGPHTANGGEDFEEIVEGRHCREVFAEFCWEVGCAVGRCLWERGLV